MAGFHFLLHLILKSGKGHLIAWHGRFPLLAACVPETGTTGGSQGVADDAGAAPQQPQQPHAAAEADHTAAPAGVMAALPLDGSSAPRPAVSAAEAIKQHSGLKRKAEASAGNSDAAAVKPRSRPVKKTCARGIRAKAPAANGEHKQGDPSPRLAVDQSCLEGVAPLCSHFPCKPPGMHVYACVGRLHVRFIQAASRTNLHKQPSSYLVGYTALVSALFRFIIYLHVSFT